MFLEVVASPTVTQSGWRWRNDNGSEASASWKGEEKQEIKLRSVDETFRLRIRLVITPAEESWARSSVYKQLSYSTSPDGEFLPMSSDEPGSHFVLAPSAYVPNGTATTQKLSAGGNSPFEAGNVISEADVDEYLEFYSGNYVREYEWVVKPTAAAVSGKYYFKMRNYSGSLYDDQPLASIDYAPVLNVSASKTDVSCHGGQNGSANVTVSGGTAPYTYNWSSGGTGPEVTGLAAGTYAVNVSDVNGNTALVNVVIAAPEALTATITKTDVTTACGADGTATVTVAGGVGELTYNWAPGNPAGDGSASVTNLPAGTYTVTITDENNCSTTASVTIGASEDTQVPIVKVKDFSVRLNADGEATVTAENIDNGSTDACGIKSLVLSKTKFSCADLGENTITLTVTDNNGNVATATATVTVSKALQQITFGELPDATYGDAGITLSGAATSGASLTYTVDGPASINGNVLTITGVGLVTVTAAQAGTDCFEAADIVKRTFTVAKKELTVVADNKNRVYGEENPALTYTITGFAGTETADVLTTAPVATTTATAESNAGEYPITVSGGSDNNYSFIYQSAILTITKATATIVLSNLEQAEDGQPKTVTATTTPAGLNMTITYDGAEAAPVARGTYAVVATVNNPNYMGTATATLTIMVPTGVVGNAKDASGIVLYPNPTINGKVYLEVAEPKAIGNAIVEIHTANGRLLSSHKVNVTGQLELDLSKYGTGFYLVRVIKGKIVHTFKVHKQ